MKTILIIEDDIALSAMYKTKLTRDGGFNVLIAENGIIGWETVKKEKPDLVLLDIVMPGMDGKSVLKRIKNNEETKDIPVIILSNLGNKAEVGKRPLPGSADYLIKAECTPTEVIEKIRKVLGV